MKKLFLSLVAVLAVSVTSAQDLRWGPTAALNLAWLHGSVESSDCYIGFQAGVKAEMDMSMLIYDGFYLDGKLVYTLKGAEWADMHQNLGYLEIPVNIGYCLPVSQSVALMAGVGPYFSLGILGKQVETVDEGKLKTDIFGDTLQRFDFGLNYNLGVEMWGQWQFFVGFEHSLINILKSRPEGDSGFKFRPINLYFGTAFMF